MLSEELTRKIIESILRQERYSLQKVMRGAVIPLELIPDVDAQQVLLFVGDEEDVRVLEASFHFDGYADVTGRFDNFRTYGSEVLLCLMLFEFLGKHWIGVVDPSVHSVEAVKRMSQRISRRKPFVLAIVTQSGVLGSLVEVEPPPATEAMVIDKTLREWKRCRWGQLDVLQACAKLFSPDPHRAAERLWQSLELADAARVALRGPGSLMVQEN